MSGFGGKLMHRVMRNAVSKAKPPAAPSIGPTPSRVSANAATPGSAPAHAFSLGLASHRPRGVLGKIMGRGY